MITCILAFLTASQYVIFRTIQCNSFFKNFLSKSTLLTPGGGTRKNFNRDARVTFLGLKFHNLLFCWVFQNEGYFLGVEKLEICIIFLGC